MFLKRLLKGVVAAMMITGMCASGVTAATEDKKIDYHAYAAKLDKTVYSGDDLGATYTKKGTTFKVWSPKASSINVNIYQYGSDDEGDVGSLESKALTLDKKTGVWSVTIKGDLLGKYYTYTVKHGKTSIETYDIYAKACGVNGKRSMIVDLSKTNPDGWENDKHILVDSQTKASVWETSVADFSSSETSGISEANRGKFLAFTENGTTVDGIEGETSTCVDYLKKLGVKYVQIMPFYDFGSIDESKDINEQYNWGYDPVNYNCPEGSYSSDPFNGAVRIKECKEMIKALHDAGIGVIMDVVYNHTYSSDSAFQHTVPNYYYRMNEDGSFSNGSGCGNDTASEHLMFRKFMIDSVKYWTEEYHIDGFRFDLMGLHDIHTMNSIRKALDGLYEDGSGKKILMYGEAWNMPTSAAPGTVMANQNNLKSLNSRIGAFDDTIRDGIKGSTAGTDKGFVQEGTRRSDVKLGFSGQADSTSGWAKATTQCVTYASCHDNLCLYDKLVDSVYGRNSEYRKRYEDLVSMNKLAGAIVITSQGIPFMLSGEEFARSKDGDENSYSSSRKLNMIDWSNLNEYSDIVEYYRGLLKIRENFAALSDPTATTANQLTYLSDTGAEIPKGVTGYIVSNTEKDKWDKMCLVFNGNKEDKTIAVDGEWIIIADNETAGLRKLGDVTSSVTVKPHSAVIMIDKTSFEKAGITDSEGVAVINYYDSETKELIKKQTVTDVVGSDYNVNNYVNTLNYEIKETSGDVSGEFIDGVLHSNVYVDEYSGDMSTVTFKFVDDINGSELVDSYLVRNRTGQPYFTPELPSIENYKLVVDDLPTNGAGVITDKNETVIYKYTRVTDDSDKSICTVNVIYMDGNGKILDKVTMTGKEGESYTSNQNEYEDMSLTNVPENANGIFKTGEINVLYSYSLTPDPLADVLVYVYAGAGVILALCIASVFITNHSRRKRLAMSMDVEE